MSLPEPKLVDFPCATISENCERAEWWMATINSHTVPIQSILPTRANLPGKPNVEVYKVAIERLEDWQRERLISELSKKFGLTPEEAAHEVAAAGIPILADDVIVMDRSMYFL